MASSSSSRNWVYDIFVSFRGEDVPVKFLSHFLEELERKSIKTFIDNKIKRSDSFDHVHIEAIRTSRIAVVVFSEKYPSSSWCLNELVEIVKCKKEYGQQVIPIFYGLDPSHVRKQTGIFGKIFAKTCHGKTDKERKLWCQSLTEVANILGVHSQNWTNEAKMIEAIANDVLDKLNLTQPKDIGDFVGIEDHIAKMSVLLNLESKEVRMVGICGSPGIGKTSIARVLYSQLSHQFQGSIFIDSVFVTRIMDMYTNPDVYNMKMHLGRRLLSENLDEKDVKISYLGVVAERLKHQKILICIDDLDDQMVLDTLVGETQWFGCGSRIVVVTKDKQFLSAHGIDNIYEVGLPSDELALKMFCKFAFGQYFPPDGLMELTSEVVLLAGNLPLGLKVLGRSLMGRDKDDLMDMLPRFRNGLDGKIKNTLRVCYDGLGSHKDKAIFCHIACLFNGEKVNDIKLLLADSYLDFDISLKNLVDKSFIHVRNGIVEMHSLLQKLGKKIVRAQSNKPGAREFLMDAKDICDVLEDNRGTTKVLGIALDMNEIDELHINENAFKGMHNLRFLKIYSTKSEKEVRCHLPKIFDYLPHKLRLLRLDGYPMRCMPSSFRPENLIVLQMRRSKLDRLWEGTRSLSGLKEINLSESIYLKELPDLSKATNLEKLYLRECSSLVELPSSIRYLNKLEVLDMRKCSGLEILPIGINLLSLDKLNLRGCSRLNSFPDISTNISRLLVDETRIESISSNLRLKNLVYFSMAKINSEKLWGRVQPLTPLMTMLPYSLEDLSLSNISSLVELPSSIKNFTTLRSLAVTNCINLETLPIGINFPSLDTLYLDGCSRLQTFPNISTNIWFLSLSRTGIEEVPWWIENFSNLEQLNMNGCNKLQCLSLHISKLKQLHSVDFSDCRALTKARWKDCSTDVVMATDNIRSNFMDKASSSFPDIFISLFNFKMDVEEFPHNYKHITLSGEEVPSYFTEKTTGMSLTNISLPQPRLSQPFFRFKACVLVESSKSSIEDHFELGIHISCRFKDRLDNHFDFHQRPYMFSKHGKGNQLFIFECSFPLNEENSSPVELNYDHVDIQCHLSSDKYSTSELKEWGIRLSDDFSSPDISVGYDNNIVNETQQNEKVWKSTTMVTGKRCRPQYPVFINFWGEEVRCSFISHLVYAFSREGVNISVRKYEKRGEDLGNTLQIIEDSNIALVVFSSRYTESRWCLEELVKIEECKHEGGLSIIPIFYKVEPSQVKQLEGDFGLNFWNLWRIHRDHRIIKWKDALESVASIDGLCLKDHSSESNFIDSIVEKVLRNIHFPEGEISSLPSKRRKKTPKFYREKGEKHESFLDKCPLFGLEHRMKLLEQKLEFDCNETRIIGVVGMTGIGKTTLAMMLHEKWNCNFVRCVALLDIDKKSEKWLRKTLLEMLRGRQLPGTSDDVTHESMKSKLLENKVFIVLDDVSNKEQLDFLLGDRNWIKNGSKVVITVRDKSLVEDIVHDTYVVPPLNYGEALQLFSYHAFGDHVFDPTVTSTKVFTEFLDRAGGNPLVIKLLGKNLHGRDKAQQEMSEGDMEELSMMSLDIFKLSFDELSEKEKNVFLDIACFFRSENEYLVRNLLDPGDHSVTDAESVVGDLTRKCMIVISNFRVEMHGLLHVFGKIYSSQKFIEENGGESRLWYTPEIIDALVNQKDAESMRGIFLDIAEVTKGMVLDSLTFIRMINLRYLKIYDSFCPRSCKALSKLQFPDELEFRMEKVRYLHWVKFPLKELPSDFRAENLVDLRLPYSMVERVWQGVKDTPQLKWVDLSHSRKLLTLSELAKAESLQKLNLEGCTKLDELPGEMQNMKSLVYLNLRGCIRLSSLPKMNLTSLKTLVLSNCLSLKEFQVIAKSLEVLHLDGTAIKGLHPSIENLQRLVVLNMRNCKMLESLPNCLGQLKALEELILSGCSRLQNLPDVRQSMKHVQILLLDGIGAKEMPKISCFTGADDQTSVDMVLQPSGSYPSDWPRGLDGVYSLRRLCLSGNGFIRLQNDIGKLYNLRWLDVKHCKKLRSVPMLPPRLQYFDAHGCDSLEKVGNPLANLLLTEQVHAIFNFSNCNKLDQDAQDSIISYTRRRSQLMLGTLSRYNEGFTLEPLARTCFPGREIPEWFSHRGSGSVLEPKLPPHWCGKRLTGIALCAVILCAGDHEERDRLLVNCKCTFENADGSSIYFSCTVGDWNELNNTPQEMELCHVFIGYTSRLDISKAVGYDEERCFCTKSSFEFQVTDGTENIVGCEVLQCGFSLVYATDDRENICLNAKTLVVPTTVKKSPGEETSSNDDIQCQYEDLHTDQLTELQKNVLLDIACFFRSEDEYFVRSLLDSGDPDSTDTLSEVKNLSEKFLIRICDGRVEMNDRQYTYCKDFGSPGGLRLCKYEDILGKLRNTQKLEANTVRGIFLDMSKVLGSFPLERTTFNSMRDLRYLKVYESCCPRKGKSVWKIKFPDGLDFPLEEVRYFHWLKFPLEELPPDFKLDNLVDLRLPYSNISLLWKGVKDTRRLKWVDLSHSAQLLNLSGLAKAENLKRLNLEGCTSLNELPEEMQNLKSLVHLNMRGCIRLRSVPEMNLVSLKTLILSDCSNLAEFQVISKSLESLYLDGTAIKELPLDIQKIQRLVVLNLKNCKMLERLPPCLGKLKVLEEIILTGCLRLKNLSDVMPSMKHVQILLFDGAGLYEMPNLSSFTRFNGQSSVDISIQNLGSDSSPREWPLGVNRVSSLRRLCLSGNDFVSLQSNIGQLYNLIWLDVKQCKKLTSVPMLPPRLEYFDAHGCDSLERVANPLALQVLTEQIHATYNFSNCNKLHQEATNAIISYTRWKSQLILDALSRYDGGFALQARVGTCFPGWEVPTWFSYRASGSLLEPKLPPHWCNNRLTGIALCTVILFPAYQGHQNNLLVTCTCKFKNEDRSCSLFSFPIGGWSVPGEAIKSSHVFIGYASELNIKKLREENEGCIHTVASFEFQVKNGTKEYEGCKVLKCGFSLVYEYDDLQVNSGEHVNTEPLLRQIRT